ncbi:MAG: hypothetical protein PHD29_00020 [bacterium]|nr:hypothetical protein [bacterium]
MKCLLGDINLEELIKTAKEWCRGKNWIIRVPVVIWLAYIFVNYLRRPDYLSTLGAFNYWVHEAGHLLALPFGQFLEAISGTLLECLIPVIFLIAFLKQGEFFGASFCFGWLSTCFFYASWYISTAQRTDNWNHDWYNILSCMGILMYNHQIAFLVKLAAVILMLFSIASGIWLLWQMAVKIKTLRKSNGVSL